MECATQELLMCMVCGVKFEGERNRYANYCPKCAVVPWNGPPNGMSELEWSEMRFGTFGARNTYYDPYERSDGDYEDCS